MRVSCLLLACVLALTACSAGREEESVPSAQASAVSIAGLQSWSYEPPAHEAVDATYEQKPPVHGLHWPPQDARGTRGWLRCGVYDTQPPEEFALHSEEHGAVWLTYRPGASAADIAAMTALAEVRPDYVIVSPYGGQPAPFMASTWDNQLRVESADDPRLRKFTQTFAGGAQGREPGADCANGTPLEAARAAVAAAPKSAAPVPMRTPLP